MKWIVSRKFNQIDIATAFVCGTFASHAQYILWIIAIFVGVGISLLAERLAANKSMGSN